MPRHHLLSLVVMLVVAQPSAAMQPATAPIDVGSTAFRFAALEAVPSGEPTAPSVKPRFGAPNSWRWQLQGGGGFAGSDQSQGLVGGGVSWFFVENLSLDLELNGVYYSQPGDDAWAVNPVLLFRWHFVARDTWSIYADGGAGIQWASSDVPTGATAFGFTPQVGIGASIEVAPDVRLMLGARWRHVSNANLDEDNEALDAFYAYAQVSFPF